VQWILDQLKAEAEQKPRAAAEGMAEVRRYPLSHITAPEALGALQKLEAIRAIDFSRFTVDQRNNAIIGSGDASVHDRVAGALAVLDRPPVQKSDAHGVPILSDIPVVGEMYKLPEKPAKSEPVSSRSFPFTAPNSGELAWVDEIYANGRIGSLEFKTNGGIMTVTGPDRDVVELGRFVNLVSSRPQSERAAIESHLKQLKADVAARKEALTQLAFDDPKRAQLESALPHLEATIRDLETILNPPGC
jgi:hypothetical protein